MSLVGEQAGQVSAILYTTQEGRGAATPPPHWVPGVPRFFAVFRLPAAVAKEKGFFCLIFAEIRVTLAVFGSEVPLQVVKVM